MKTNPNHPISPVELGHKDFEMLADSYGKYGGLTKREYFAAMAIQGLLVAPNKTKLSMLAEDAVSMADALITALNK